MPLYIDNRGKGERDIERLLRNYISKSDIKVVTLESGDYVFGEVGIERKAISDLYHTLYMKQKEGGRLWRQLDILKHTYKYPFLLIEGQVDWSEPVLAGVLNSVLLFSNVKLIFTDSQRQTAIEIVKMYNKYGTAKSSTPPPPAVIRGKTIKEVRWGMLQCVRGIGPNGAKKILEVMPWIFKHENKPSSYDGLIIEEKLKQIKGVKKEAKEMIVKVFTE
jgi:ERCC4-type nuclease